MIKYFFALIEIIKNYHFYSFFVLSFEIFFNLRYGIRFNKFDYYKNNSYTDPVPCCFYFIRKINNFFQKNSIDEICDLGSGYGKMIFYFGKIKKKKIDGIELNKEIFNFIYHLCDENINIYNGDILNFDFSKINYQAFIVNDPLKKDEDFDLLLSNLEKLDKKIFIVFININKTKQEKVQKKLNLIENFKISSSRGILFCKTI